MRALSFRVAAALACLSWSASRAQDVPTADEAAARLAAYMDGEVAARGFMGAVLVARDGQPIFRRAYGPANADLGVPNTPETRFRIGSITKPFTALAVLVLRDQGKLALDDPIATHLKDAPEGWKNVTIRHLLTHTSGIPSYTSLPDYRARQREPTTVAALLGRFRDRSLEFEPGERFAYSNSNYVVLGALIEEVSGQTYEAFLRAAVLEPLGLADTGYDHPETVVARRAAGHRPAPDGGLAHADFLDMGIPYAAGSLYSTVDDLARLDAALRSGALLSEESYCELYRPAKDQYALGWIVDQRHGRPRIWHNGGINGFSTSLERYPDESLCVVVLSNNESTNAGAVASNLSGIALGEEVKPPVKRAEVCVAPEILERYVGRYQIRPGVVFVVRRDGGRLIGGVEGRRPTTLFAESQGVFYPKETDATIEFVVDGDGPAHALILRQGGGVFRAPRLDPKEPTS